MKKKAGKKGKRAGKYLKIILFGCLVLAVLVAVTVNYLSKLSKQELRDLLFKKTDLVEMAKKREKITTPIILTITPTPQIRSTVKPDLVGPEVNINFPFDNFQYDLNSLPIRVSAYDPSGVTHVEFYINGNIRFVDLEAEDLPDERVDQNPVYGPEYSYFWTPGVSGSIYILEVRAYDKYHNMNMDNVILSTYRE